MCIALDEIRKDSEMIGEIRGEMKGETKGIVGCILILKKLGYTFEIVVENIAKQFELSYEAAEALTRKNWKFD